jgi:hypothetical protein
MDGKVGAEPYLLGVNTQKTGANSMKRSRPRQGVCHDGRMIAKHLFADTLDTPGHFGCRATRECHQQYPARISAIDDQVSDTMRQCVRLARSSTRDDQKWTADRTIRHSDAMLDRFALAIIQFFQMGHCHMSSSRMNGFEHGTADNRLTCPCVLF